MAAIHSLGLHEPSALSHLVSEGLLPANPPPSAYSWSYQQSTREGSNVTAEILQTANCVVWSRNGIIKRVFNLDIEGESITHAFTTYFRQQDGLVHSYAKSFTNPTGSMESALVVLLKTQAHIYLLSGDTHVVPLSFEVHQVIPAAFGFFLQRRLPINQVSGGSETVKNEVFKNVLFPTLPTHGPVGQATDDHVPFPRALAGRQQLSGLPRTFAFPELLAELSVVLSGSARRHEPAEGHPILSVDEEIVYISTNDELHELRMTNNTHVYLAVTVNMKANTLTVWQVTFKHNELENPTSTLKFDKSSHTSKRKSSNIYSRQAGVATPTARIPGPFRESVGGMAQSIPETGIFASPNNEKRLSQVGDLAAHLGHEFEHVGVQTRSARRVSSMLARTDLGSANDRTTFTELAQGTFGRKSFGRGIRRGDSLGGFSDRQSFGARRRSSFQAASSIHSDGTSFLDLPASQLLDDGHNFLGIDAFEDTLGVSTGGNLPRDVVFIKLKSLPYELKGTLDSSEKILKVTTLLAPDRSTADDRRSRIISVCVMDSFKQELTIVNIAVKMSLLASRHKTDSITFDLKAVEVQRGQSIVDACRVAEGLTKRLLILTQTREGKSVIHLEAPWSASYRVTLPTKFKVFDPSRTIRGDSPVSRRDTGVHRTIPGAQVRVHSLRTSDVMDEVIASDTSGYAHRMRIQMQPSHSLTRKILRMCNFVLAPEFFDSLLVAWWEVKRWMEGQSSEKNMEWTAMTVTLFVLAVPFISNLQSRPAQGPKRKKGGLLRSSSGTTVDLSNWHAMQEAERTMTPQTSSTSSPWTWMGTEPRHKLEGKSAGKHVRTSSADTDGDHDTDSFLVRCVNLARDFLQSPAGESATGPEGYLPVAVNKERNVRRTALASIQVGLHLLREELKLHEIVSGFLNETSDDLAMIIAQIGSWLGWKQWCAESGNYYHTEVNNPGRWLVEPSTVDNLEVPAQPFSPPAIFEYVHQSITNSGASPFPSLLDLLSQTKSITINHPLWKEAAQITPRLFAVTALMAYLNQPRKARSIVKHMLHCGIDRQILDTIPAGIAAVCHQAIVTVRGQSTTHWTREMRAMLDRADLDVEETLTNTKPVSHHTSRVHDAIRDHRTISNNAIDADSITRWDAFSEVDRQAITKLMFPEDRRFQEASKLVNQTRPPVVECTPEPGWSEADLLEAQKELAVHVTRRTLSVAAGRAMMHFNGKVPLLTERVPIPAFSLQSVMKSRHSGDNSQPMTLSADKALFTEDKVCWAFFHNGASAGLMISKDTRWIDTSWILYNKPPELTNRHAGFLLALGLNGHLRSLAKWVAFKYLTPKHTMTSVGLLLGLAASYLGTMDTLVARLLSVHVTRLLPIGAAELNLSPLTQATGIIGVGLLYYNSQHRRMSEIMLSEIENSDSEEHTGDEPILRDEGYRLAAGFSLGLINLGQGRRLHSLHDMNVVERLLTTAIGTKNVNLVHVLDRATAGAVIAVAFIYMKTNDDTVAQKIDIPDTMHQFDYVRPDIFLLRTLARHLIMWDSIKATRDFVQASLPSTFRKRADLTTTKRLSTDDLPFFNVVAGICFAMSLRFAGSHRLQVRDLLVSYLDQFLRLSKLPALSYDAKVTLNGVRNCLDVLALSCATVMSGSGDIAVMRRLRSLHGRVDKDTPFGSHLAAHMALGVLFLSGGTATFGTNSLAIAALVISLYPIFPVDVLDNKGHLQSLRHLWVLAVENRCLVTRDVETQQIISDIQAEVELVDGTTSNVRSPCLLPEFESIRKVTFNHESYWPVQLDFDSQTNLESKPGDFHTSKDGQPRSFREVLKSRGAGVKVFLQRRMDYEMPETNTFFTEIQALDETRGVPSVDVNAVINRKWRQVHSYAANADDFQSHNPIDWIFERNTLRNLSSAERSLVLGDAGLLVGSGDKMLKDTVIDSILDVELGSLGLDDNNDDGTNELHLTGTKILPRPILNKDKLWQLRLLLDWIDRWDREETESVTSGASSSAEKQEPVKWIKEEVVDNLRWRIWKMAGMNEDQ